MEVRIMGARVGLRPDKWDKKCNGSDEMTPAPVVLKLASVLTALFRFLALASLGAFVYSLVQAVDGKTSPFNCIHFVQYFAESSVWYLVLSQAKAAIRVAFNDGTPFSATIPLRIKRMAILLIVLVILGMLFSLAASWLAYDAPPSIGGISMGYSGFPAPETWWAIAEHASSVPIRQTIYIPLGSLLLPIVLLLISIAMEYGCHLQKEHNETI